MISCAQIRYDRIQSMEMIEINGTEKYIMKIELKGMVLMTKIDGMTKINEIGKLTLKSKLKDKVTMTKNNGTKKTLNGK